MSWTTWTCQLKFQSTTNTRNPLLNAILKLLHWIVRMLYRKKLTAFVPVKSHRCFLFVLQVVLRIKNWKYARFKIMLFTVNYILCSNVTRCLNWIVTRPMATYSQFSKKFYCWYYSTKMREVIEASHSCTANRLTTLIRLMGIVWLKPMLLCDFHAANMDTLLNIT